MTSLTTGTPSSPGLGVPVPHLAGAAGIGACAAVAAYAIDRHYLRIEWTLSAPVPVAWWVAGQALAVLGLPLLLACLGRRAGQAAGQPWPRLLTRWTLPWLALHAVWLAGTLAVLHRYNPNFTGTPVRDAAELARVLLSPPPELGLGYAIGVYPIVAKALRRVPALAVIGLLAAASTPSGVAASLLFLTVGDRLSGEIDRSLAARTPAGVGRKAAVALAGASLLGVPGVPDGLAEVLAALAALPFGLTAAAMVRGLPRVGAAVVPIMLLAVPALAMADAVLLDRISVAGSAVQLAAAVAEPLALTGAVVVAGLMIPLVVRKAVWW
jgi:hypothetical protein